MRWRADGIRTEVATVGLAARTVKLEEGKTLGAKLGPPGLAIPAEPVAMAAAMPAICGEADAAGGVTPRLDCMAREEQRPPEKLEPL